MRKIDCIVRDPEICGGQPTVKGTRVLVLHILEWINEGESNEEILDNFPSLTIDDIHAIIEYGKKKKEIITELSTIQNKIRNLEQKYNCFFKEFEGEMESQEEDFEKWDDFIDWTAYRKIKKSLEDKL